MSGQRIETAPKTISDLQTPHEAEKIFSWEVDIPPEEVRFAGWATFGNLPSRMHEHRPQRALTDALAYICDALSRGATEVGIMVFSKGEKTGKT